MAKLPIINIIDKPIFTTSQKHIPVADITEDLILMKNGAVSLVLESTSLNFGLLSEVEQEAVIASYAGLLNSLTFHIQITVRSQQKDISGYIHMLEGVEGSLGNDKLKQIMKGYKTFIIDSIKKKNVLSKKFYVVLPFTQYELGVSKSFASKLNKNTQTASIPYTKPYVIRKAKIALFPKREHLMRQSRRLGLQMHQLKSAELISLIYEVYNPKPPIKKIGL